MTSLQPCSLHDLVRCCIVKPTPSLNLKQVIFNVGAMLIEGFASIAEAFRMAKGV